MFLESKDICGPCPQRQCGMRGTPMSVSDLDYAPLSAEPPKNCVNCSFYTCIKGADEVEKTIAVGEFDSHDLAGFGTSDKPFRREGGRCGITGRYTDKERNIFVKQNGTRIFLTNIRDNPPGRGVAFLRKLVKSRV